MSEFLILFAVTWVPAGIIAAGFGNARIQRRYPIVRSDHDLYTALFIAIPCGWGALILELCESSRKNFKFGWSLRQNAVVDWKH